MKIIDFFSVVPGQLKSPVVTLGVFDGMHRGHQALLGSLLKLARQIGGEAIAITFERHPMEVLKGSSPPSIVPFARRLSLLEKTGMDGCLTISFNRDVAEISATSFLEKHLVERIGMKGIVVGPHFKFGRQGSGNYSMLEKFSKKLGYKVVEISVSEMEGRRISSTHVRKAVLQGEMEEARRMLGRPFSLIGRVVHGKKRGRLLGFPTANLSLTHELLPPEGVYAGYAVIQNTIYQALASIGKCPTFEKKEDIKTEVYLVDFSGDLYGSDLEVFVCEKIRDQIRFDSVESLCEQIEKDKAYVVRSSGSDQRQWGFFPELACKSSP